MISRLPFPARRRRRYLLLHFLVVFDCLCSVFFDLWSGEKELSVRVGSVLLSTLCIEGEKTGVELLLLLSLLFFLMLLL
jgi:hypothetical protein